MREITIYEADDGNRFDTEEKCMFYEMTELRPELLNITFYDENGVAFKINPEKPTDDSVYFRAVKIELHGEIEWAALHWLAVDRNWVEIDDYISSPGLWEKSNFDDHPYECIWVKNDETCFMCKHEGKYENEFEAGYNSPCTNCKRRVHDNYEPKEDPTAWVIKN